jgi:DNA-binding transcriptional LysR family regulator
MTLDSGDLDAFLVVVREGSFGRAASALLVSQPTVSERIARLERAVGAKLFVRGPRGVSPTQAGDRLLPMAQRIVGLMDEAEEIVRSAHEPSPLRVGVHSTFAYRAVPLVVSALESPTRGVRVRDAHSDEIIAMLLDGVLDAGFVLPGARPPTLRFVALPPDPVVCVCAPTHELASARSVTVRSIVQHDVALNLWGTGADQFENQLAPLATTKHWIECSDAGAALQLARHHGYLAFVVHSAAQGEVAAGVLKKVMVRGLPPWSVRLVLASRAKGEIDGDVESLRRIVREAS